MNWFMFGCCLLLAVTAQTTLTPLINLYTIRPDVLFILVVFFALYLNAPSAHLAGWILGLVADLTSVERNGLFALTFLIAAILVHSIRHVVFLRNRVTHFAVTLLAGLLVQLVFVVYRFFILDEFHIGMSRLLSESVLAASWTAVWAVPIHAALCKGSRWLGLHVSSYPHAGLHSVSG